VRAGRGRRDARITVHPAQGSVAPLAAFAPKVNRRHNPGCNRARISGLFHKIQGRSLEIATVETRRIGYDEDGEGACRQVLVMRVYVVNAGWPMIVGQPGDVWICRPVPGLTGPDSKQ
jgi:hypothetical protein